MSKLIDVKNVKKEKAFELHIEPDSTLFLRVKCSDNKHHSKVVLIEVDDAVKQIARAVGPKRWKAICGMVYGQR